MRLLIFFILLITCYSINLKIDDCPREQINKMEFYVCNNIVDYKKLHFHDITGENLITAIPDRLYRNHKQYVAYYNKNIIYIATELYAKDQWANFIENLKGEF